MSSRKCPHCGFVSFSTAGPCKRCKKDLAAPADPATSYLPAAETAERGARFQSDQPLLTWAITIVLLITNASLAYAVAKKSTTNPNEAFGGMIGGMLAWPLVLLIVYGLSKKFRENYSLHAVINYGLALNSVIQATMPR